MTIKEWAIVGFAGVVMLVGAAVVLPLVPVWWRARRRAGAAFGDVLSMRMRMPRRDVARVLEAAAEADLGGVRVSVSELETQTLAGGDVRACVEAMVEAKRRGQRAEWRSVRACDLAGVDVVAVVRAGVDPGDGVLGGKKYEGRFRKP